MRHLDLFSGIGGFALAAEMVWGQGGVQHIFCDNDPFCQAILRKHWPESPIYGDIKNLSAEAIIADTTGNGRHERGAKSAGKQGRSNATVNDFSVDLLTGGFPCQPFSSAGRRRGKEDDRHLWPEMLRVIRETQPRWVIGENVGGLLTWNGGLVLDEVFADLEAEGYEVGAFVIPAAAVGAPHRRDRVWIVARNAGSPQPRGLSSGEREEVSKIGSTNKDATDSECLGRREGSRDAFNRNSEQQGGEGVEDHGNSVRSSPRGRSRASTDTKGRGRRVRISPDEREATREVNASGHSPSLLRTDADPSSEGWEGGRDEREGQRGQPDRAWSDQGPDWSQDWLEIAPRLCRVDDGIPKRLDRNSRLKGLGNAIVPQVAAQIMRGIKAVEEDLVPIPHF